MSALIVLKGETTTVFPPHRVGEAEGVWKLIPGNDRFRLCLHMEKYGLLRGQNIASLGIHHRGIFRLQLIGRRRLNVVNDAAMTGNNAIGDETFGIGRPNDSPGCVVVAF